MLKPTKGGGAVVQPGAKHAVFVVSMSRRINIAPSLLVKYTSVVRQEGGGVNRVVRGACQICVGTVVDKDTISEALEAREGPMRRPV